MAQAPVSDHKKFEIDVAKALEDRGDDDMIVSIISQGLCYRCQKNKRACKCECKKRFCPDIYGEYQRKKGCRKMPFVADCKHYGEDTYLEKEACEKIVRDRDQMKTRIEKEENKDKASRLKGFIIYTPGKISKNKRAYLKNEQIRIIEVNDYEEEGWKEDLREMFKDGFA